MLPIPFLLAVIGLDLPGRERKVPRMQKLQASRRYYPKPSSTMAKPDAEFKSLLAK
jgi:hypothetical protein